MPVPTSISQVVYQSSAPGVHPALIPIPDASHTRNRRVSPPDSSCLPGTRQMVRDRIRSWALDEDFGDSQTLEDTEGCGDELTPIPRCRHVLWLCGPVGSGKSAISQAVAEEFEDRGLLLGSFFFFRGSGDRSRIARLLVTLARQMADAIPETRPLVEAAVRASFGLHAASPKIQFRRLICQPLQAVLPTTPAAGTSGDDTLGKRPRCSSAPKGPFLCILDGIDECNDRDEVRELIDDILHFFEQNPRLPLRFLIASRIEEHIRAHIEKDNVHIENLHDYESQFDILALVQHSFQKAVKENRVIRSYGIWPCAEDMERLVQHAGGSFIFITTLLKHILGEGQTHHDGMTPMERFKLALDMSHGLEGLYKEVLHRAEHVPTFREVVLSIAGLRQPLSIRDLAIILDISPFDVANVLVPLQSIILVPGDDKTPVTVFHKSLRDYILETGLLTDTSTRECDNADILLAHKCFSLCVKLGSKNRWGYEDQAIRYAYEYLSDHWSRLQPSERCHKDFLISQLEDKVSTPSFQILFSAYRCRRYLMAPVRDAFPGWRYAFWEVHYAWDLLDRCSKRGHFLSNLQMVYQKPMPNPEPCMHRCIVMHCMRVMVGSDSEEELLSLMYAMDTFTYHLSLGLQPSSDDDDDDILNFLQVPYTVLVECAPRSHRCDFIPRTKTAFEAQHLVQAINTKVRLRHLPACDRRQLTSHTPTVSQPDPPSHLDGYPQRPGFKNTVFGRETMLCGQCETF